MATDDGRCLKARATHASHQARSGLGHSVGIAIADMWHHSCLEKPQAGTRIVMLYSDGSGARVGFWTGEGVIEGDGDERPWDDEPGEMWAYLPPGFELWCETRSGDPYTFPAQGTLTQGAETTGSVGEADSGPVPNGDAPITSPESNNGN